MKYERIVEIFIPVYINDEKTVYLISDHGRCFNTESHKFISGTINSNGRRIFAIHHKGKLYRKTVARWIALVFIDLPYGTDSNIFQADHIDEDITNDALYNIQWITAKENINKHYYLRLNEHIGENNPYSNLTEDTVHLIFHDALAYNMRPSEIAEKYCINRFTVQKILSGINWKYIYNQYDMSTYHASFGPTPKYPNDMKKMILKLSSEKYKISEIKLILLSNGYNPSESLIRKIIKNSKL